MKNLSVKLSDEEYDLILDALQELICTSLESKIKHSSDSDLNEGQKKSYLNWHDRNIAHIKKIKSKILKGTKNEIDG